MRLHRQWKRAISFLTSVVMTTVSIVPGIPSMTAYAAPADLDSQTVYVNGTETPLDENDESLYDSGTYTRNNLSDDGEYFVSKQFDWTDGSNKTEGDITFQLKLDANTPKSVAVYSFTPCEAHGFNRATVAEENIKWMLQNYEQVDLIWYSNDYRSFNNGKSVFFDIYKTVGTKNW